MTMTDVQLAVHGGAGAIARSTPATQTAVTECLSGALQQGRERLLAGDSALDVVQGAVRALEACPELNAGRGSVLDARGDIRMDAALMCGSDLAAGAVAGVRVHHPIDLARAVLTHSPQVLLSGPAAEDFGLEHGIAPAPLSALRTERRYRQWQRANGSGASGLDHDTGTAGQAAGEALGTVGAIARDGRGHLAAATSTGGLVCKAYGRVSDSAVIGAGTYAEDGLCAVSATGRGEDFIRTVLAKHIAEQIRFRGCDARAAVQAGLDHLAARVQGYGGVIVLDRDGRFASGFSTEGMFQGVIAGARALPVIEFLSPLDWPGPATS